MLRRGRWEMARVPEEQPHAQRARGWLRNGNPPGDPSSAPRCRARTRRGTPCQGPCVRGRGRCRMHGGAQGSGPPRGNQNARRHGEYSAKAIAMRRQVRALLQRFSAYLYKQPATSPAAQPGGSKFPSGNPMDDR
ncbi:HGGxSTG domain-containing protein [Pseudorhodoplanes sp.]|uniref:HGGxSTG domain-containing protein n=1 Tax=Pseudorhodoplanes sp. TaxID=1934341 RepID=UPI003D130D51